MTYNVVVSSKRRRRRRALNRAAKKYNLIYSGWDGEKFVSKGDVTLKEYKRLKRFCSFKKLKLKIMNEFSMRSANYRQVFFDNYPPAWKDKYFCVYCGSLVHKSKITIDHLYPVNSVQTDVKIQEKLKKKGWTSINDARNLVPACSYCNRRKSAKTGIWILKGRLGQITWLWVARHIIKVILFVGAVLFLIQIF